MTSVRFAPSRAGIVNLWDYRDEEFLFVDGWLVLRGPNGSGKTKALEVLFPFVLDGRIEPRRLNPFASEERTMKSNLLYRGQDSTHAYVWMEFHRPGDPDEYVTVGIGLRAHKHQDRVVRWHFVTDGRVGEDFSLIDADDRPLTRKDLIAELGVDNVHDGVEQYRRAVDGRLFGLGAERYEQFLDLVLTLRKPQLAKDLNPVELSRTLQRGLRPLDDGLIAEAAGSFDAMEAVAKALEGLVKAEQATTAFLSVYSTYLRTHARAAADAVTARRAAVDRGREALDHAVLARGEAQRAHDEADGQLQAAEGEPGRLRSHLDSLKASAAYRDVQQLENLRRHVADLADALTRSQREVVHETSTVQARATELAAARVEAERAEQGHRQLLTRLATEAEEAGIVWGAGDAEPEGLAARLVARAEARRDDVRVVREHLRRLDRAEQEHARAARDADSAREATAEAEQDAHRAAATLAGAREAVAAEVSRWGATHGDLLADLPAVQAVPALGAAVAELGAPSGRSLPEVFAEQAAPGLARVNQEVAAARSARSTVAARRDETVAERELIASARDDAPAPAPGRRADRSSRPGAPLWRLVDFAPSVKPAEAAGVEAALEAAGLLDAWVDPDPGKTATAVKGRESDGYLVALPAPARPSGRTLADLLVVEAQDAGAQSYVPPDVVTGVLSSIAVHKQLTAAQAGQTAVSTSGQFGHPVVLGAHTKPAAEYIGATARERRRAARIAECDRIIAELDAQLVGIDDRLSDLDGVLARHDAARAALPGTRAVLTAVFEVERAATTLSLRHAAQATAVAALDQAVAEQSAATSALRRVTAERSLPVDLVDATDAAVRRFEAEGARVEPARRAQVSAHEAVRAAQARHDEAGQRLAGAQEAVREAAQRHEEMRESYETLAAVVGDADVARVVREVTETETAIASAQARLRELQRRFTATYGEVERAKSTVDAARTALRVAVREAGQEALGLRPFAHADLLRLLRCPSDLRWPSGAAVAPEGVEAPDGSDESLEHALAPEVAALHEAILHATKDLTPTENSLKQSATRLNGALTELQVQLPGAGLDHRPEIGTDDGLVVVRVADDRGLTPVATFAERIARERADQEQLLTDAERRVFEDALLTQLARQIHHRTIESRDLVEGMDKQMRSRRMSSGLTVGVGWQLADDLDTEAREICRLLDRDPARLGPTQLAALRGHFASRIKAARAMAPEQPYRELLAHVLDYRLWRVFAFSLHLPGALAEPLTRSRHSQLSGGEQSVSLHLPLFAAANALFSSASPTAPRLLGMDEAFAGVDENGRGELMSLAVQFDLDLFMTGFDLWATHPAVPGCAHYDLSHSAVDHAVGTVLIVWNGRVDGGVQTADFDGTLARALGSPATRRSPHRTVTVPAGRDLFDDGSDVEP